MRAEQHKGRSKWWRFVAATTTEWLQSRAAAEAAERDAIAAEAPVFNKAHNARGREAALDYLFDAIATGSLAADELEERA